MNAASFPAAAESSASGPALVVRDLEHAFATRTVLEGVSLRLPAGETLALVGPSGCGKSTLLHLCAGLLDVRSGEIHNGFARTAMLFQQPTLLPWKTTLDNIALGLKAQGVPGRERLAQATRMGNLLGLDDVALAQFPHQLSGGMQSRAALARALVLSPDLLLLDEPTSALDPSTEAALVADFFEARRDATIIASIHRPSLLPHFDAIILVEAGRVVSTGRLGEIHTSSAQLNSFLKQGEEAAALLKSVSGH